MGSIWKATHIEAVRLQKQRYYSQSVEGTSERSYSRWTMSEIRLIQQSPLPDRDLADALGRSIAAVQMARSRSRSLC